MGHSESAWVVAGVLFVAMLACLEWGRRFEAARIARYPETARAGAVAVEGAVFALFGLLLAFTFSGAAARFDARRALIVEEANDIGTAYLRLDLLPLERQDALRELFRRYLDSRLETYRKLPDVAAATAELAKSTKLQGEIWRLSVAAGSAEGAKPDAAKLLLPALNAMIDITTTRTAATRMHPPGAIFLLLLGLACAAAFLVGDAMATARLRSWVHILGFVAIMVATIYVILDLEYPRMGLIRVDDFDQLLVEVRATMR